MSDAIKVAVRLRPLLPKELAERKIPLWETEGRDKLVSLDAEKRGRAAQRFAFDRVFGLSDTNATVYDELVEPLVLSAVAGFNVTVFAYGQTASGKTHTMLGGPNEPGVIHKAIDSIFSAIENTPEREYLVRIAYMEIYNENISDLLAHPKDRKNLKVSDVGGDVFIQNLKEQPVVNKEQILDLMAQGHKQRHVGSTSMNEHSSRSHAIFRIVIESRIRDCEEYEEAADGAVQVSHLNLVDLAGSEKASQTGATGDRFKEGCAINTSLLSLSVVIKKLSEGEKFVSFRDSKLTHILRNSLGGNAKTAIICAVTPVVFDETLSTLNFASRAKTVTNDPHVNEVLTEQAQLKRYALIIRTLEKQLKQSGGATVDDMKRLLDEKESKIRELKEQLIVSSHVAPEPSKVEVLRQARRMTWGGPALRAALSSQGSSKPRLFSNHCSSMLRYNSEESVDSSFVDANIALSTLREDENEEFATPEVFVCTCQRESPPAPKATTTDSGVQTDEAVAVCAVSTPVPVLRRRLTSLQETVKKQAVEYEELAEFTRLEKTLGVGDERGSDRQMTQLTAELDRTRQTLNDTNGLLLETQKKFSLSEDLVKSLSQQVRALEDNKRAAEITIENLQPLISENQNLRKTVSEQQSRLNLLENEKLDWETVLQINAEAYKKKESELKQLLQEAWSAADIDPEFYSRAKMMEKRISELTGELSRSQAESESLRTAADDANELATRRFSELEAALLAQKAQLDLRECEIRDLRLQLDKAAVMSTPVPTQGCSLANELRLVSEGNHMNMIEESILEDFTVTVPSKPFLKRKTSSMTPQELLSQTLASLNASIFADSPLVKKYKTSDSEEDAAEEREDARVEIEGLKQQLLLLQEALIAQSNTDHSKNLSGFEESGEGCSEDGNNSRLENIVLEKEALAEAKEELEKRVKELEEQLDGISKVAEELKILKAELQNKDALILELDELIMNLREELESARSQVPMEGTATDFKLEYEAATAKMKELLQEKDEYQRCISSKEEEWRRERMSLEEALGNLKESYDQDRQEAVSLDMNELLLLRAQNADYLNEIALLQQEMLKLKTEVENLHNEINTPRNQTLSQGSCVNCENLLQRISEREAELQKVEASTAQRVTELQNIATEASDAREKLSNEIEEKMRLLDDLTLQMAEFESSKNEQISSLEQELTQVQDKYAQAIQERQHALEEAAQYSQQLQSHLENKMPPESQTDTLETELIESKRIALADCELSFAKSDNLEASVVSRHPSLDAVQREQDLMDQLDEKEKLLREIQSSMKQMEALNAEKITSLERELAEAKLAQSDALEACQQALEEAMERVQQQEIDLGEKDNQLEKAQSNMVESGSLKTQEIGLLEEELSRLKSANSEPNEQALEACQRALDETVERLQQLESKLIQKEKQLEEFHLNMAEFQASKAREIGQLEEELSRVKSPSAETNEQALETCHRELDEAIERLQQLNAQLVAKDKMLEEAQLKMSEFRDSKALELRLLEEELARLKSANCETKEQALEACQRALDEANERVQQVDAQLMEKVNQVKELQSNLVEFEKSKTQEFELLKEELSRLESASAESEHQSQKALEEALQSVHRLRAQLEEREKSLRDMQLSINELESVKIQKIESLQAELAQAKVDEAQAREQIELVSTRAREEKEQLESVLQKLEKELEECRRKIENIQTKSVDEVASLKEQLTLANSLQNQQSQKWQKTIAEEMNRRRVLEAELQTKEVLVIELTVKVAEVEALKDEVAAKDRDLCELHLLRTEITNLKSTVLDKQDEWERSMQSMSQLATDFERRLRDKENAISSLQAQCRDATGLQTELNLKESLIAQLESELLELRPLRQAKQELEEDLEDWQRKFNDLGDLFDMRNERYEMACDDLAKADEEIKQLKQKLEAEIAVSKELAQTKGKVRELLEEIDALTTERNTLSASLSTKSAEFQRVTEAYHQLEQANKVKPVVLSEEANCEKLKREISSLKMEICRLNGLIAVKELQMQNEDKPHQVRCNELQAEVERYKKQIKELKEEVRLLSSRQMPEENTVALLATKKVTTDAAVGTDGKSYGCGWCIRLPDIEKQLKTSKKDSESLQNDYDLVAKVNELYYKKMRKYRSLYYELKGEPEPPVPEMSREQMLDKELAIRKTSDSAAPQILPQGSRILAENRGVSAGLTGAAQAKASKAGATSTTGSSTTASSEDSKRTSGRASAEPELYQMKAFTTSRSTHANLFDKNGLMKDSREADWRTRFANFDFLDNDERKSQQTEKGSGTNKEQVENRPPTNKRLF